MSLCRIHLSRGQGEVYVLGRGPIQIGDRLGVGEDGRVERCANGVRPFAVAMEAVDPVPLWTAEIWDEESYDKTDA